MASERFVVSVSNDPRRGTTGREAASDKPLSLVVLGGGTSGWITACWLIRQFGHHPAVQVTLVESKSIGILGVGEATLPTLIPFLRMLGISEADFMSATKATFKRGILYKGWRDAPAAGQPTSTYFHPFASADVATFNSGDWWINKRGSASDADYCHDLNAQGRLACENRAPRGARGQDFEGDDSYAYHMDAELFAQFLAGWCKRQGIRHLVADVTSAEVDANGYVAALNLGEGGRLRGDVFFDCSGFRGLLINQAQKNGFTSYGDSLFCDQAVALRLPHAMGQALRPYTTTTAWQAGWLWEIDLQGRSGLGYVHSSRHTSFDEAEAALRAYVGPAADQLPARRLKMRVGRSNKLWDKNVIAIGLSGGFIEPLESTGIYLVEVGARHAAKALVGVLSGLLELKLGAADGRPSGHFTQNSLVEMLRSTSYEYNSKMVGIYEEIRDFVKIHFSLTRRMGSEFWIDNQKEATLSVDLREKLSKWRFRCPDTIDFDGRSSLFNEANWLYVMLGMGWRPGLVGSVNFHSDAIGTALMRRAEEQRSRGLRSLPTQNAFFASQAHQAVPPDGRETDASSASGAAVDAKAPLAV